MMEIAEERNKIGTWGFKSPHSFNSVQEIDFNKCLRNPRYFAIWKDPLTVTRRRIGPENKHRMSQELPQTCRKMMRAFEIIKDSDIEVNMLSYTHAVYMPRKFVMDVVSKSGLRVGQDKIEDAINSINPNTSNNWRAPYPQVKRRAR